MSEPAATAANGQGEGLVSWSCDHATTHGIAVCRCVAVDGVFPERVTLPTAWRVGEVLCSDKHDAEPLAYHGGAVVLLCDVCGLRELREALMRKARSLGWGKR